MGLNNMPYSKLDRFLVKMKPLADRENKVQIERDHIPLTTQPKNLSDIGQALIHEASERIRNARANDKPVILAFGAHTIKNGLAPALNHLMERGWLTHLATNGAGVIHDWEFAFQGESSEYVKGGVLRGEFGNWQETGFNINLALNIGAYEGLGYGESVGAMIENEGLTIPAVPDLEREAIDKIQSDPARVAAIADLITIIKQFDLQAGWLSIPHPWKQFSTQATAYRLGIPFTGHPMIGHDIIYNHPMNHGGALGRVALRDFLTFAEAVSRIDDGVYLSLGSAVMSPMIFEKSLSMAQNLALQKGDFIESHYILVADLAQSSWDWTQGEPPEDNPDYYLRFNKSFSRMGGTMRYLTADNRDFLLGLCHELESAED
jgi:hypothetical protein